MRIESQIKLYEIKSSKKMKLSKALVEHGIIPEKEKYGTKTLVINLRMLLNKCLDIMQISEESKNMLLMLLWKRAKFNLKNYKPINLLCQAYQLVVRKEIVTSKLTKKFDRYHNTEQAGFRKQYST